MRTDISSIAIQSSSRDASDHETRDTKFRREGTASPIQRNSRLPGSGLRAVAVHDERRRANPMVESTDIYCSPLIIPGALVGVAACYI